MEQYDILSYIPLLVVLSVFIYVVMKLIQGYFNYFSKLIRIRATVLEVGKAHNRFGFPSDSFGSYYYCIEYDMNGAILKSTMKGFSTPYYYKIGEGLDVLVNKRNFEKVIGIKPKGQVARILGLIIVTIMVTFGAIHSLQELNVITGVSILTVGPYLFVALSVVMFVDTVYAKCVLKSKSIQTTGTIVDMKRILDVDYNGAYRPIIEYLVNEEVYRSASEALYYSPEKIGTTVPVTFLADMPKFGSSEWLLVNSPATIRELLHVEGYIVDEDINNTDIKMLQYYWILRNQTIAQNIDAVAHKYPDTNIVVFFGASHVGPVQEELNKLSKRYHVMTLFDVMK